MRTDTRTFVSTVLIMALLSALLYGARRVPVYERQETAEVPEAELRAGLTEEALAAAYEAAEPELLFWYDEEKLTPFFRQGALDYYRATGIAVAVECRDSYRYLDEIYAASIGENTAFPDSYLLAGDALEAAVLLGLAEERTDGALGNPAASGNRFMETAVTASMLRGTPYGYPLCFHMPVFAYLTDAFSEAPVSIQAMLDYIAEHDLPIVVGNLIEWDVGDEYYDFAFVGDCYTFSDEEKGRLSVTTDEALLREKEDFLAALSDSITVDPQTISEGSVVSRLNHQATASAILDSDDLAHLTVACGVLPLIDLTDTLSMKGTAVTDLLLVNGFSEKKEAAAAFVSFLSTEEQENIEALSVRYSVIEQEGGDETGHVVHEAYRNAVPMPHSMDADDFWKSLRLEIMKFF